jgi:tRNA pseudouridine38-40 synthase
VEYDGTNFCGFQFQPRVRTVAGELERALAAMFGRRLKVTAAGRTDAGVHAVGQVVSFDASDNVPIEKLPIALSASLPPDLTIREAACVEDSFSARFDALERYYVYAVLNRRTPSAVLRRFAHHEYRELDDERMRAAARDLCGTHDFTSFCAQAPENGTPVRTLHAVEIERRGELVLFRFAGESFLHRMVRIAVGTLLEVGSGRRTATIAETLAARDRRAAGLTAPPQGLYLAGARYRDFNSLSPDWRPRASGPAD